jgi:membrane-associated phospholipid phosphatase
VIASKAPMVTPIPSVPAAVAVVLLLPALSAAQTPPQAADIVPVVSGVEPSLGLPDFREKAPSLREVFGSLRHDFPRLASRDHAWIAAVGASGAFGGHMFDHHIAGTGWGSGTAREIFAPGAFAGGAIVQSSAALGTYALGRAFDRPRVARIGGELIRAQILAQTVTQTIKMTVQRTRPDGSMLSFPSGHTSATFATATVLHRELGWKTGVPAYAVASWVAASRMHAERHYLSDVIMGATIGILAGRSVTIETKDARFSISPIAVRGGAGVSIVRVK